jgi:hypothetical protein
MHFCYSPPGGELGHGVAAMLGIDAGTLLAGLLMRAKNFLETGRHPRGGRSQGLQKTQGLQNSPTHERSHRAAGSNHMLGSAVPEPQTPWPHSPALPTENIRGPEHFPPVVD